MYMPRTIPWSTLDEAQHVGNLLLLRCSMERIGRIEGDGEQHFDYERDSTLP